MLRRVPPIDADAVAIANQGGSHAFRCRATSFALRAPRGARTHARGHLDAAGVGGHFIPEPVASYEGYLSGFPATRPQAGRKLDPDSPAVLRWQQHLVAQHDAALAA